MYSKMNALPSVLLIHDATTEIKAEVVEEGGIELVVNAMENHPNAGQLQNNGFLTNVANNGEYRNRVIQAKCLVAVVEAKCNNHQDDDDDDELLNLVRDAVKVIGI